MMNRVSRFLVVFAALAMVAGCSMQQSFKDADAKVAQFHSARDRGQWQTIWTDADPQMRESTSHAQFDKLMSAVHRKLGKVRETKQTGWNANATTGGTFATLTYQTTFERGSGVEQFVYRKGDAGRLTLVSYTIQSQDMMLD